MDNENRIIAMNRPLSGNELVEQVNQVQAVMKSVMKKDDHYGTIPGCGNKPTLFKSGAEKIALAFRFRTSVNIEVKDIVGSDVPGHREYQVAVDIITSQGEIIGTGVGCCSTMESKYRFRTGQVTITDKLVPKEYWDNCKTDYSKALKAIGGKGHSVKKNDDGKWMIAIQGEKCEFDNPADNYNTCMKMAKKRAYVDGIITATAASDIFTQDIEDITPAPRKENGNAKTVEGVAVEQPAPTSNAKTDNDQKDNTLQAFIKRMEDAKKTVGDDKYYEILNKYNYKHSNKIFNVNHRDEILALLTEAYNVIKDAENKE